MPPALPPRPAYITKGQAKRYGLPDLRVAKIRLRQLLTLCGLKAKTSMLHLHTSPFRRDIRFSSIILQKLHRILSSGFETLRNFCLLSPLSCPLQRRANLDAASFPSGNCLEALNRGNLARKYFSPKAAQDDAESENPHPRSDRP